MTRIVTISDIGRFKFFAIIARTSANSDTLQIKWLLSQRGADRKKILRGAGPPRRTE